MRCSPMARSTWSKPGTYRVTPGFGCWAAVPTRWAGSMRINVFSWCEVTVRRSVCVAAPPSSGWRWICCSMSRWASCRWAAKPARASPLWRCVRVWKPCWSDAPTARWWSSARCTRSAARSWATCPVARARRWARGRRRSSTPSRGWPARRCSRKCCPVACSRCCR